MFVSSSRGEKVGIAPGFSRLVLSCRCFTRSFLRLYLVRLANRGSILSAWAVRRSR